MSTTTIDATGATPGLTIDTRGIAGHPRGLTTLFFTEMWERFSFYGMRALLMLYMTKGLNFEQQYAGLIYGTYASSVYWTPLIGGWLADKIFGARRAVLIGGIIIACGHFSMVFHSIWNFYGGLILISIGTGLLKPNISAMVGDLYAEGDQRRDAGFSIFYMGINLGALFAPIVCGYLGQKIDWHYGFGAAGIGMVLGVLQYVFSGDRLSRVGNKPVKKTQPDIAQVKKVHETDYLTMILAVLGGAIGFSIGIYSSGQGMISGLFPGVFGFFTGYILGTVRHLNREEARRVGAIFILFLFSALFWTSFEQGGSSLTLFADRDTRNVIFGWSFPSSWYQSVQPAFIVLLAPLFAVIWARLGSRQPSSPIKFALGLFFAGVAFLVIAFASTLTADGTALVSLWWLILVYLIQTIGELCLSPVGLSTVTKLSPGRMVGLMMGVWFLSISIGDFVAGLRGGQFDDKTHGALLYLFGNVAVLSLIGAVVLVALTPLIKRLMPKTAQ